MGGAGWGGRRRLRFAGPPPPRRRGAAATLPQGGGRAGVFLRPFGMAAEKFGEGAGRPGSPGAVWFLPFRRDSRPASSFSTRPPAAGRSLALPAPARCLAVPDGGGRAAPIARRGPTHQARGEQEDAIHRRPQGPPRSASPGLHRSTTARRHREALDPTPSPPTGCSHYRAGEIYGSQMTLLGG